MNVGWSSSQLWYTQEYAGGRTGNLTSKMQKTRHWTFLPFSLFFSINVVFTWDAEMRFNALPLAGLFVISVAMLIEKAETTQ